MSKYFLIILAVFVHLMFTHTACTNIDSDSDCAIIDRAESMLAADSLQEALNLLREDSTKLASKPPRIAMRFQLMLYNAMDQCFVPMKNDSMMKEVEKYYAINGNAYEQTLSRYLLAACYRDMNLYDECQKWANEAEEKADTLDKSFDYLLLYKLSGLKGELYVYKTADEVALQCYQNAAYYANKAKDPLRETDAMFRVAYIYSKMKQYEKAKELIKDCIKKYKMCQVKETKYISLCLIKLAEIEINQDHPTQAGTYLNEVEKREGHRLDSMYYVLKQGLYSYYPHKSDWYSLLHDYPAALACSKKEHSMGGIFQGYSCDYMANWFAEMKQYDSAYIYLRRFVQFDDSVTKSQRAAELQATQHFFEAKKFENRIREAKQQTYTYQIIAQGLAIVLLWGAYLSTLYFLKRKEKENELKDRYGVIYSQLENLKEMVENEQHVEREISPAEEVPSEVSNEACNTESERTGIEAQESKGRNDFGMNKIEYDEMIKILEKEASNIEIKNSKIKNIVTLRNNLSSCKESRDLRLKIKTGARIRKEDLAKMEKSIRTFAPAIHAFLTKKYADGTIQDIQYWTCILTLFNIRVSDIAEALNKSQSAISMCKKRTNIVLFNTNSGVSLAINLLFIQIYKGKYPRSR